MKVQKSVLKKLHKLVYILSTKFQKELLSEITDEKKSNSQWGDNETNRLQNKKNFWSVKFNLQNRWDSFERGVPKQQQQNNHWKDLINNSDIRNNTDW